MSDKIWEKINYIVGLLPIGALFGLIAFVANVEIRDFDLWLHIATGKFITLNNFFIPKVDFLSCSIAGREWINHEWLFQVIVYNIFNLFGPDGLLKMQIVIVIITMLFLLFLGYSKERQLLVTVSLCLVYLVYNQRFTIRPDLYSLLFFVIYIYILALHIDKKWAALVLFTVQIVWSNMHGFFFFGPLFVLIGLISEWIKRHIKLPYEWNDSGRLTDEEYKRIKLIFLLVILACFINPFGIRGAWYPINVFFSLGAKNKIFFGYIQELKKPMTWGTIFNTGEYLYYKFLILLSVISFIFNRRRIDISALFFWLVFLIFSLKAVRNTSFFAFSAYLVIITNMVNISWGDLIPIRFTGKKYLHITLIFINVLILLWIISCATNIASKGYYDFDKHKTKSHYGGISLRGYPDKAADFLVKHNIKGNFFNDFNSGAYLLGRCFPNIKVFIDGRTEVYGGDFFKRYQKIWKDNNLELFEEYTKKHNFTGAFLNGTRHRIPKKLLKGLYGHEEWVLVYFNYDAVIFLRDTKENKELIDELKIDLSTWQVEAADLFKLGASRVKPYHYFYRAYTLESLGFYDAALAEANEAIKITYGYADPHNLIGKIYAKKKEYKKAFESFRRAAIITPYKKDIRHNLALVYLDLEEYEGAVKQYKKLRNIWPDDPKAYFLLSKAYIKDKQYDESKKALQEAIKLSPSSIGDILEIGDIAFEQEEFNAAKEIYELALRPDKDSDKTYLKIGLVYKALGDVPKAADTLKKGLSINPDNEEIKKEIEELQLGE